MVTYFGEQMEGIGDNNTDVWILANEEFTCPGSGNQEVKSLEHFCYVNQYNAYILIGIYSADGNTKICEGASRYSVVNVNQAAWVGHTTFSPATPILVGGVGYRICESIAPQNCTIYHGANSGKSSQFAWGDYTNGLPDNLSNVTSSGIAWSLRCGVDPASSGYTLAIDPGSYSEVGTDFGLLKGSKIIPDAGSYSISGTDLNLLFGRKIVPESGSYAISGATINLFKTWLLAIDPGSYSIAGTDLGLLRGYKVSPESGLYSISGIDLGLLFGRTILPESGSYAVTGTDFGLRKDHRIPFGIEASYTTSKGNNKDVVFYSNDRSIKTVKVSIASGYNVFLSSPDTVEIEIRDTTTAAFMMSLVNSYFSETPDVFQICLAPDSDGSGYFGSLDPTSLINQWGIHEIIGSDVGLYFGGKVSIDPGSYSQQGTDFDLLKGYKLVIDIGDYTIVFGDLDLIYSGDSGKRIIIDSGSFSIVGNDIDLRHNKILGIDPGSYAITGQDLALLLGRKLASDPGGYTLEGSDFGLKADRKLSVDPGNYIIDGKDLGLLQGYKLVLDAGSYAITGQDISLLKGHVIQIGSASYLVVGTAIQFIYSGLHYFIELVELDSAITLLMEQNSGITKKSEDDSEITKLVEFDSGIDVLNDSESGV